MKQQQHSSAGRMMARIMPFLLLGCSQAFIIPGGASSFSPSSASPLLAQAIDSITSSLMTQPSTSDPGGWWGGGRKRQQDWALRMIVGTGGGGGRRGRGRGGDDGRPLNMSDDKNYEAFFKEREKKRMINYDEKLEMAYYEGMDKNVKFMRDDPSAWDGTPDRFTSISRDQAIGLIGVTVLGTGAVMAGQRWRLLRRYTSPTAFSHPYDSQTARRPFSIEQFRTAVRKASVNKFNSLPSAPSVSSSLPFLRGSYASFQSSLREGKAILYHFWRPSNLNSIATLCRLEAILDKYGEDVDVISIHAPKYDEEGSNPSVEAAIRQVELASGGPLRQKVVADYSLSMWKDKGMETWPSLAVGVPGKEKIIFFAVGDRVAGSPFIEKATAAVLETLKGKEEEDSNALSYQLMRSPSYDKTRDEQLRREYNEKLSTSSPLRFPTDVVIDPDAGRIYITDAGNHRIIVTDRDGKYIRTIGSGRPGFADGFGTGAVFNSPQGLALDLSRQLLYVSDTFNDRIRAVDLKEKDAVSTLRPSNFNPKARREMEVGAVHDDIIRTLNEEGKDPKTSPELGARHTFRLPTQLAILDGYLYVAASGSNQIWRGDPYSFDLSPLLGSGAGAVLNRRDPTFSDVSALSAFAEPTGIAALAGKLLVAEAESSTIREVDFRKREAPLRTVMGSDRLFKKDLSAFGDSDGFAKSVRVQRPTAMCTLSPSSALLADTYNHKIKVIKNPNDGEPSASRLAGSGRRGYKDGPGASAEFNEPRGLFLDALNQRALVCDSNNHVLRIVDVVTGQVSTFNIKGLDR